MADEIERGTPERARGRASASGAARTATPTLEELARRVAALELKLTGVTMSSVVATHATAAARTADHQASALHRFCDQLRQARFYEASSHASTAEWLLKTAAKIAVAYYAGNLAGAVGSFTHDEALKEGAMAATKKAVDQVIDRATAHPSAANTATAAAAGTSAEIAGLIREVLIRDPALAKFHARAPLLDWFERFWSAALAVRPVTGRLVGDDWYLVFAVSYMRLCYELDPRSPIGRLEVRLVFDRRGDGPPDLRLPHNRALVLGFPPAVVAQIQALMVGHSPLAAGWRLRVVLLDYPFLTRRVEFDYDTMTGAISFDYKVAEQVGLFQRRHMLRNHNVPDNADLSRVTGAETFWGLIRTIVNAPVNWIVPS